MNRCCPANSSAMLSVKDFYLLRSPLLPVSFLNQFEGMPYSLLGERLKVIFSNEILREAIYIASPELYQEFLKWMNGQLAAEKTGKLLQSLFRYLLRMSTRCTPYGLFAGCATGRFDSATNIALANPENHKKHCRLDMNYVAELANMIGSIPEIKEQINFFPNSSIYKNADKFRYAEYTLSNKIRSYYLTEVNVSSYLEKILEASKNGAKLSTLAELVTSEEISSQEAEEFIEELVSSQIIVSELEPTLTGKEFFKCLISKVSRLKNAESIFEQLEKIEKLLYLQDTGVKKYLDTRSIVKDLLPGTNDKDLIQTDLFLSSSGNTIRTSVIEEIKRDVEKIYRISSQHTNSDMDSFIRAFRERYEEQEISLALALDSEAGIGYAGFQGTGAHHTPLVNDIREFHANGHTNLSLSKLQVFQIKKLQECLRNNKTEIEITDIDLDELKEEKASAIPKSLYLMGSLLGKSALEIDAGKYLFQLNGISGPSAGTLLARFCHGDETLTEKVKECLHEEETNDADKIYAEVIHLPEARTGNVLMRPQLRDYEIVYLGNGSVAADHQIFLEDLLVSIRNNAVVLRSKKLNKEIIPRLSTAHNFGSGSLPVYRFLCDLQFQQLRSGFSWQWTTVHEEKFFPRVTYKKIILSRRTWTLEKKDYADLKASEKIDPFSFIQKIQQGLRLPQHIAIVEGDNELHLNLHSEACVQVLVSTLIKKEKIVLQEYLATDENCFVNGTDGNFTNELIVPLQNCDEKTNDINTAITPFNSKQFHPGAEKARNLQRKFNVGSEWLFVKIYCGTAGAERILKDVVKPLTDRLIDENKIDKWFFLRYADPEHHLRVRFHHGDNPSFWKDVLQELSDEMDVDINNSLSFRVQTDTYEREIERYGASTIELSEDLFYYDSKATVDCVNLLEGEEGEKYRWLIAARGVDMLMNDFGLNLRNKSELIKYISSGFFTEFGGSKYLTTQLNDKYRTNMQDLRKFLDPTMDLENAIEEFVEIFNQRSGNICSVAKNIRSLSEKDPASKQVHELLPAYIHMFLNRIFPSNQRKHELVIHHFLSKYYESQIAVRKFAVKGDGLEVKGDVK